MSNQYFNIYYDPVREGYDPSTWRALYGQPVVGSNQLMIREAGMLHYGDILRGDSVISLKIPAPAIGADRKFGFLQFSKNAYAYFKILNGALTAETSNGTTSTAISTAITWQSAWTDTNTEFRIKWEAGTVTFFIGGAQQTAISDISVSGDPMSIYLSNNSGSDTMLLNYMNVKGIQSYRFTELVEGSSFEFYVYKSEALTISEAVTMLMVILIAGNGIISDTVTVSESVTVTLIHNISVNDALTVTDNLSSTPGPSTITIDVNDVLTVSEDITRFNQEFVSVNDVLTITESVTTTGQEFISVTDTLTLTESSSVSTPA